MGVGGKGKVGVMRGDSAVGVGHQLGISLPLSVVVGISVSEVSITLGEKVGVGGDGKVGVIGSDSPVRVGHQLGISVSLAIDEGVSVDMRHRQTSSVHSEGEVHSSSLGDGLLMVGGGLGVVGVEGSDGTVRVGDQLGGSARN